MPAPTPTPQRCAGHRPDGSDCTFLAWADGLCAACFITRTQQQGRVQGGGELHHARIRRCTYRWVPTPKPGSRFMDWRQCNAAILPTADYCHRHGGATETDLGRSYAEAVHAAQTTGLTLPSPWWWQAPQRRWETLSGRGTALFARYPDAWAEAWNLLPERWLRTGDRVAALAHYLSTGIDDGYTDDDLVGHAIARCAQPHLLPHQWATYGQEPKADSIGLATTRRILNHAIPLDPRWTDQQQWGAVAVSDGHSMPVLLFPEDETQGGPHQPIPTYEPGRPADSLDLDATEDRLHQAAASRQWRIEVGIAHPDHGVAHFDRENRTATIFHGVGDRHVRLWALAHTAGHIALGHGACGDDRTLPHEADAEAFAILALHRAGHFNEVAANTWRAIYPVDLEMLAFERLRAATAAVHWLI